MAQSFVEIVGKLGGTTTMKELPSGDTLTTFSVIVERSVKERVGRISIDTIPCQTFRLSLGQRVIRWEPGTVVTIRGVLRRRFWRSPQGLGSALEVEVRAIKRGTG